MNLINAREEKERKWSNQRRTSGGGKEIEERGPKRMKERRQRREKEVIDRKLMEKLP